jgi:carboxylesterase type B
MITMPMTAMARAHSARAPAYVYRLRWSNEDVMVKRLGTPHTLDVPLVFGNRDAYGLTKLGDSDTARELSTTMQGAWLGFAADPPAYLRSRGSRTTPTARRSWCSTASAPSSTTRTRNDGKRGSGARGPREVSERSGELRGVT